MELKPGYKMTEVGVIPEDWTETKISSIAKIIGGGTPSTDISSYWNGEIPWFTPAEINDENKYVSTSNRTISQEGLKHSSAKLLPYGTILLTTRASIGLKAILLNPATTNQGFQNLIVNKEFDNQFIYYLLEILKKEIIKQASGSTFLEISPRKLGEIHLYLPERIQEQQAIAAALSDVDELLSGLDRLIAKKKDIRLATMQELLTGKKRLPGFQVSPAFQKTEVGTIPEDWDCKSLGDCTDIFRGGSPRPIEAYLTTSDTGYNWIKIGDVQKNEKFIYRTEEKIIEKGVIRSRFVHKGDFLLSNSMSFGRPYILKIDGCIHDGWLVIQNYQSYFDTNFLYYLLCSDAILKQYKTKASGSGVLNLNKELVSSIKVIHPSLAEQQAIASVLSDMDAEIEALEARREKVRNIKTGMMQELLTGKTRLVSAGETA